MRWNREASEAIHYVRYGILFHAWDIYRATEPPLPLGESRGVVLFYLREIADRTEVTRLYCTCQVITVLDDKEQ